MITTQEFRLAVEDLSDQELSLINRFRCRRALRNGRLFNRWYQRVAEAAEKGYGSGAPIKVFDGGDLLSWLAEHWDEILKLLLAILPLFI